MLSMPFRPMLVAAFCVLLAAQAEELPSLQASPGADGIVTWWLVTHTPKEALETAHPPKDARAGTPIAETGGWQAHVSSARFLDFRPLLKGTQGTVWASCRIKSNGGARKIRAGTFSALRVFLDGKEVLKKAQPLQPYADEVETEVVLPKGECELSVGMNVRYGYAGFQFNLTEGKDAGGLPRFVAGDTILLPHAPAAVPNASTAALEAITFIAKDPFVNPGQKTVVMAALLGSVPAGIEAISGRFMKADGSGASAPLPSRNPQEFYGRNAWTAEFAVPPTDDMRHALALEITSGGKVLGKKQVEVFSLKGIAKTAKVLSEEITNREKAVGKRLPHAALAAEKLILYMGKIESGEERVAGDLGQKLLGLLDDAKRFADIEAQGEDPHKNARGHIERAYVSKIDDGVQPYYSVVPSRFGHEPQNENKEYPLVIFLHGYVPSYDKHRWWDEITEFNDTFERNGAFMAMPFGRSNTDFQSCGEVDVLDVIADMRKRYPIDPNRIYLYGYSMGGMAVYHIAAHNPDLFAGAIAIAGRADSPLQNKKPLTGYHPYKQWLIHADNPISLCENLVNIPLRIYHGNRDFIIDIGEARRMEKRLKDVGATVQLFEVPGDHFFGFDLITTDEPLKWLLEQRRKPVFEQRWMKQYSLRYAGQGGLQATAWNGALEPLEVKWSVAANGKRTVAQKSPSILQVVEDGKATPELPPVLRKTPQRCGPVREAICNPFLVVYGTTGSPEANQLNKKNAEQFAQEWFGFTRSRTTAKADTDVTDEEKKTKNLFLFGEQQENSLHASAAEKLPIQIKNGSVAIGAKSAPLKDRGAIFTYPSPFAPQDGSQVIVVYAGLMYGQHIGINHKFDLLPDFILYGSHADTDGTGTNHFYCAGFFDGEWKLNEKTTWWQE